MKNLLVLMMVCFICIGCGGTKQPTPNPYNPPPEESLCVKVCYHYEWMGCNEAKPTPENHTCKEVCENLISSLIPGLDIYYDCVLKADNCNKASDCDE